MHGAAFGAGSGSIIAIGAVGYGGAAVAAAGRNTFMTTATLFNFSSSTAA